MIKALLINLHKIDQLIINGLKTEPVILVKFFCSFIFGTKPTPVESMNEDELFKNIENGKSLIRLGDGEVMLMMGRDIHYQPYSLDLGNNLLKLVKEYSKNTPYILGIPTEELRTTEQALKKRERLRIWRLFRVYFKERFPLHEQYCSLVLFYHQNTFENKIATLLKNRHIVCVSNEKVLDSELRNYFTNTFPDTDYIIAPGHDAYSKKDETIKEILAKTSSKTQKTPIVLLAAGPASKIIAFELAKVGVQSLDIGHGMEIIGKNLDYSSRI